MDAKMVVKKGSHSAQVMADETVESLVSPMGDWLVV